MNDRSGKSYRVGVIGFAHMHVNELVDRFFATGRADIVACADTQPRTPSTITIEGSRRANMQRTLAAPGGQRAYQDYRELLSVEKLDIADTVSGERPARRGRRGRGAATASTS